VRADDVLTVELSVRDIVELARAASDAAKIDDTPARLTAAGAVIGGIVQDFPELEELKMFRGFIR
jgi:hypothetical protein